MLSEYEDAVNLCWWFMMIWDEHQEFEPNLIAFFECAVPGRTFEEQLGHPKR